MTLPPPTPRPWTAYVALGDSFTEGLCDPEPEPPTGYAGWADRLAGHLSARAQAQGREFAYANLAVRGRKLDDVVGRQLDAALAMRPDLVSIVGGGNDILRPRVDLNALASRLEDAVARIRATGADVLLATPSDVAHAGVFRHLRGRHAVHTANVLSIAGRHGAGVVNIWQMRGIQDWRMWSQDRIHLTSEGHHKVALAALDALGFAPEPADWLAPIPPAPAAGRRARAAEHAAWTVGHVAPWVRRRVRGRSSGDLRVAKRPELTPIEAQPLMALDIG